MPRFPRKPSCWSLLPDDEGRELDESFLLQDAGADVELPVFVGREDGVAISVPKERAPVQLVRRGHRQPVDSDLHAAVHERVNLQVVGIGALPPGASGEAHSNTPLQSGLLLVSVRGEFGVGGEYNLPPPFLLVHEEKVLRVTRGSTRNDRRRKVE